MKARSIAVLLCVFLQTAQAHAAGKLEIHVLDVGQGDAILIRCPHGDHELLIDSGDTRYPNSSANFKEAFAKYQKEDDPIECVVATHPHADHIGNMKWVLDSYEVKTYVDNGFKASTAMYKKLKIALKAEHCVYKGLRQDYVNTSFCPLVKMTVLRPEGFEGITTDQNSRSVVVRLDYKDNSFLFTGDAEGEQETFLEEDAATKKYLDVDFLKVGHHASSTSSSPDFLNLVTPKIAVVSCGAKGVGTNAGYKHPRFEVLGRLLTLVGKREGAAAEMQAFDSLKAKWKKITLNKAVYVTTTEGELKFESDGKTIDKL